MRFAYVFNFRINLSKAISGVGELTDRINTHLSTDGYDEKVCIVSEFPLEMTVNRELTKEEEHKMKTLLEAQVIQQFPEYDVRLASFSRKSVTSKQAVQ